MQPELAARAARTGEKTSIALLVPPSISCRALHWPKPWQCGWQGDMESASQRSQPFGLRAGQTTAENGQGTRTDGVWPAQPYSISLTWKIPGLGEAKPPPQSLDFTAGPELGPQPWDHRMLRASRIRVTPWLSGAPYHWPFGRRSQGCWKGIHLCDGGLDEICHFLMQNPLMMGVKLIIFHYIYLTFPFPSKPNYLK